MTNTHLQENIDLIAKHEQEFLQRRTTAEKIGDSVAGSMGSIPFVIVHALIFITWAAINTIASPAHRFDPPPFQLLSVTFAFEAILLASFVLMRQSRISRRTGERDHLELQVLLLTEKEITAVLSICREIAQKLDLKKAVAKTPGIEELTQETPIDEVAATIRENLTENTP